MHLHLDPVGGVAGDMFAAAVLDAWPELEAGLIAALGTAGVLRLATVRRREYVDHTLSGSRFEVRASAGSHDRHRSHQDIQDLIRSAELPRAVRERTLHIFDLLAKAEAKVHGVPLEEVGFHEVGHWDSIADIVSAAWLIDALEDASWSCEALPLGRGRVTTAHGSLPVPAPATAALLEGLPTFQDEYRGERVTPTGAAIVRHLNPSFEPVPGVLRLTRTGTGFGTRVFEGLSNTLRLLVFEPQAAGYRADRVSVCAFEVDDQTSEDLAVALDLVRAVPGVLDVTQSPISGKKGRLATRVQVLAKPDALRPAMDACFQETTTLGIRWQTVERALLERRETRVEVGDQSVEIKRARRPGELESVKAGIDDLAGTPGGRAPREDLRRRAEARAADLPSVPDKTDGR
jgi:uncharacterized protein (TIGR00299 family) protein